MRKADIKPVNQVSYIGSLKVISALEEEEKKKIELGKEEESWLTGGGILSQVATLRKLTLKQRFGGSAVRA